MKLIDGYVRVSTEEQATDGNSLQAQRARIEAYAALYGSDEKNPFKLRDIVEDPGESGKSLERPALQEVLGRLRRKEIDGLIVAKLDRLTRSLEDWCYLIGEFFGEKKGRELLAVDNRVDTLTANGRLMLNLIVLIAQWERETISERTSEGLRYKISRGERCGRIRFGYDLDVDGPVNKHGRPARLVENQREQEVIRLMRQWESQGRSLRAIGQLLADMGIATKDGKALWLPSTIKRILDRAS